MAAVIMGCGSSVPAQNIQPPSHYTRDVTTLPRCESEMKPSACDARTAVFEVVGLSGKRLSSIELDVGRLAADLEAHVAKAMNASVYALRLLVGTEVLDGELQLQKQGVRPSSVVQVSVMLVKPFFNRWENASIRVSHGQNAGMLIQKIYATPDRGNAIGRQSFIHGQIYATPDRSNAIGTEGFVHGLHTARFRKVRGGGNFCHIGVCCGDMGLGCALATAEKDGGGGGAWFYWDGGELRSRVGNSPWTTLLTGLPKMTSVGSTVIVSLNCEVKTVRFMWSSGQSGEIANLPSVPLHFLATIKHVGDAWEAIMLENEEVEPNSLVEESCNYIEVGKADRAEINSSDMEVSARH